MGELEDAWDAVWDVLPAGWSVAQPVYHEDLNYWVAYCRDPHHRPDKPTPPYVEAAAPTEPLALRDLARNVREVLKGRVPK
jgi:hypothetical protein